SRRRHTRSTRDWSSDVCSSDLCFFKELSSTFRIVEQFAQSRGQFRLQTITPGRIDQAHVQEIPHVHPVLVAEGCQLHAHERFDRSEERRVGKEGRGGWASAD